MAQTFEKGKEMSKKDTVQIHSTRLRELLDEVELLVGERKVSSAMDVLNQFFREAEGLRYSLWHTYHTSGRMPE